MRIDPLKEEKIQENVSKRKNFFFYFFLFVFLYFLGIATEKKERKKKFQIPKNDNKFSF